MINARHIRGDKGEFSHSAVPFAACVHPAAGQNTDIYKKIAQNGFWRKARGQIERPKYGKNAPGTRCGLGRAPRARRRTAKTALRARLHAAVPPCPQGCRPLWALSAAGLSAEQLCGVDILAALHTFHMQVRARGGLCRHLAGHADAVALDQRYRPLLQTPRPARRSAG